MLTIEMLAEDERDLIEAIGRIIGLSSLQACRLAKRAGLEYRVLCRNGKNRMAVLGNNKRRVNVSIQNGIVEAAIIG